MATTTQVFISHDSEADHQFAARLAADLEASELVSWIAPESIRPGEQWLDAISRGIETSSHFVLVSTPQAHTSHWVRREVNLALIREADGAIELLPVEAAASKLPLWLRAYQMTSFREDYDGGFRRLLEALKPNALGHWEGSHREREGCPQCDAIPNPGDRFCSACGAAIGARPRPKTERHPPHPTSGYVFVAYAHGDHAYATMLARALETRGLKPWTLERLQAGSDFAASIVDALVDAAALAVLITPASSRSTWVAAEIDIALREGVPIFPLLVEGGPETAESIHLGLVRYQYEDVTGGRLPSEAFFAALQKRSSGPRASDLKS